MSDAMLHEHVRLIYDTASTENGWEDLIPKLVADIGCDSGSVTFSSKKADSLALEWRYAHGYREDAHKAVIDHFHKCDEWTLGLWRLPRNSFHTSEQLCPRHKLVHTEFYNDFCKVYDVTNAAGGFLSVRNNASLNIAFQNAPKGTQGFAGKIDYLNRLRPHLIQAARIREKLLESQANLQSLRAIVDSLPVATMLVDDDCRIEYANEHTGSLLSTCSCVNDKQGRLVLKGHGARAFPSLVRDVIRQGQGLLHQRFREGLLIRDGDGVEVMEVSIQAVSSADALLSLHYRKTLALVYLKPVRTLPVTDTHLLRRTFQLSAKEAELAEYLAQGKSMAEISALSHKSLNTLKTQLCSLFTKTGTRSQAQLVARLCNSLAACGRS